jgi:hypothetical protein
MLPLSALRAMGEPVARESIGCVARAEACSGRRTAGT